jgi:hypothetical protein
MTTNTTAFSALTAEQQVLVLSAYAFNLTMLAREGYVAGGDGLSDPRLLRRINEVQHRVTSAILSRLKDSAERYPDDVLISVIGAGESGDGVNARLRSSFQDAWRMAFGVDLGQSFGE